MFASTRVWMVCAALLVSACAQQTSAPEQTDAPASGVSGSEAGIPAAVDEAETTPVDSDTGAVTGPADTGFDIDSVPLSEHPLGAFPFFSVPAGYREVANTARTLDFGEAAFWTGTELRTLSGRVYAAGIRIDRGSAQGKQFSDLEVVRNLEHVITAAGGVEIASGPTPAEHRDAAAEALRPYHIESKCYGHAPQQVFVLRRADGNVWVRTCRGGNFVGLIVLQEQPLEVTSMLLPARELQQALADTGRVALQVHFATDRAEILAESQPQIEQIVELMQADPALSISIEGHTDSTGNAARNRALSEARAQSVVAALVADGIDASRLQAAGFGDTRPVDDNSTETGRAMNRRVELVRRP